MKPLLIAVLLAIMQAPPPVQGKAVNDAAGSGQNIAGQGEKHEAASAPAAPIHKDDSTPRAEPESSEVGRSDTQNPIRIGELPLVSVRRDWADWGVWIFSGLLVVVGFLQVWLLFGTLRAIKRQADLMEKQTGILERSVVVAEASADAAYTSAQVAMGTAIPTLVVDEFGLADMGAASLEAKLQSPKIRIVVKNYGQTPAFLKAWSLILTCEALPTTPVYGSPHALEKSVVLPDESLVLPVETVFPRHFFSAKDVEAIVQQEKILRVYGRVQYGDLFGSPQRYLNFCETLINIFEDGSLEWCGEEASTKYTRGD